MQMRGKNGNANDNTNSITIIIMIRFWIECAVWENSMKHDDISQSTIEIVCIVFVYSNFPVVSIQIEIATGKNGRD